MKQCILCGKSFQPRHNAQKICEDKHYRKCKFCGNEFLIVRPSDSQQCCSKKCTEKLREQTMVERYGVTHALKRPEFVEKAEQTQLSKYGYRHAAQSPEIKEKSKQIFLDKYGVSTPFLMDDFQDKSTATCLERYGVRFTSQIPSRIDQTKQTCMKKYGSEYPLGNEEIAERFRNQMMDKYGVPYYCMTDDCRSKQKHTISTINREFITRLYDLGIESIPESVKIDRYSYDVFIPVYNTVIEINPTDTHNALRNPWSNTGLSINYHRDKTQLAREHGYRCKNIWSWDDMYSVIQTLLPKESIYARKCSITMIDNKTAKIFEDTYHLQKSVRNQKVCIGLYYGGELVQIMTFGTPRYNKKFQWELLRLCSCSRYQVIGGPSKLWSYFINKYHPDSIISYCDLSKFEGSVYTNIGMVLDHVTLPNKIWSKGKDAITNNLLLQRGYDQLFHTNYGKGTSNEQLMIDNGWLPVYDCGQAVYTWTLNETDK